MKAKKARKLVRKKKGAKQKKSARSVEGAYSVYLPNPIEVRDIAEPPPRPKKKRT